jgi:hypothetical protein
MMHRNYPSPALRAWLLSIAAAATSFSNPIPIPEYTPITEIQAVNPNQWTIEVDLENIGFSRPKAPYSTDTIMLDCINSSLPASNVSMKRCAIKETVDTGNIVLLTEKHFPNLQIQANRTIYVCLKDQDRKWTASITQNISSPGTSLKFMYTGDPSYALSSCPSLGIINYKEPKGRIAGTVRDKNRILVKGIRVYCMPNPTRYATTYTISTNAVGYFETEMLDSCHAYSLEFFNDSSYQISDTVVGPLNIKSGTSTQLDIVLRDYTAPPVDALRPSPGLKSDALVRLLPSDMSTRQIVVAVSGSPLSQKGKLDIYSMNGFHIRSLPFACMGSGTYTIPWNGCNKKNRQVPGGSYICRVKIGNEVVCKGIITK